MDDVLSELVNEILRECNGEIRKEVLVSIIEDRIGRELTPVEIGLRVWHARGEFLKENKLEIMGANGNLSIATPRQSLNRRSKEIKRALNALEYSTTRASVLAQRDDISEEDRKSFIRASERANTVLVHAADSLRKSRKKMPPGLD